MDVWSTVAGVSILVHSLAEGPSRLQLSQRLMRMLVSMQHMVQPSRMVWCLAIFFFNVREVVMTASRCPGYLVDLLSKSLISVGVSLYLEVMRLVISSLEILGCMP